MNGKGMELKVNIARVVRCHNDLTGLIRVLTWPQPTRRAARHAPRELDRVVRAMRRIGWGEEAEALTAYCRAMPEFGKAEGEALMRRISQEQCERRIAAMGTIDDGKSGV